MRERFKQWPPTIKINKWWGAGAIATPVLFWMVWWLWLLPGPKWQPDGSRLSHNDSATLVYQHRKILISGIGTVAMFAGGVFLFLNFRLANSNETANLNDADLSSADLSRADLRGAKLSSVDLNGVDLNGVDLSGADLSRADLSSAHLNGADLSGADLNHADLRYTNLSGTNLSGADLSSANLRYANLSNTDLRYADLRYADLRYANLSGANLNCTLLSGANLSDANLSGALLFFINSRDVLNLEPLQLKAEPSPFLCNVALPSYSSQPNVNPNRDCDRIPQLLSDRYDISLEEAQGIVDEARQHRWD
ncbi:MAG: pentapeptide repeat-containing protein [Cyanothece sp. SIO2G6]|nr:pentapeptide repeat-containing protein [Cyanothece sp. SIO2G6]